MFNIDYLSQLIANGIEENAELDYKAAAALLRDDKKITEATDHSPLQGRRKVFA